MNNPATFDSDRELLLRCHRAALAAVDPVTVVRDAVLRRDESLGSPALLAIGKAAAGMLTGAISALDENKVRWRSALAITATPWSDPPPGVEVIIGDHPVPGEGSLQASNRIAEWIVESSATPVVVLLSGGTSSLIAAPLEGLTNDELGWAWRHLSKAGLDIIALNSLRRRLTRWGGGRLGQAIGNRAECVYLISDVAGSHLASIGSGPLIGGTNDPDALAALRADHNLTAAMPPAVLKALAVPPPELDHAIPHLIVADDRLAQRGALAGVSANEFAFQAREERLDNSISDAVSVVSAALVRLVDRPAGSRSTVVVWSAEMTVRLPTDHGTGGRAQQFALELGLRLEELARERQSLNDVLVLAASTDGRDGPTNAAGAFGWSGLPALVRECGESPQELLARADVHATLDAAGALIRTGSTGTNVADLVFALVR